MIDIDDLNSIGSPVNPWPQKAKLKLEPHEVLIVAFAHLVNGVDHPTLTSIFGVNQGRIAEAVMAIRYACEHHKEIYRMATGEKKANGEKKAAKTNGD